MNFLNCTKKLNLKWLFAISTIATLVWVWQSGMLNMMNIGRMKSLLDLQQEADAYELRWRYGDYGTSIILQPQGIQLGRRPWGKTDYENTMQLFMIPRTTCVAQNSIVFMKTHKTGGSAIQNLCLRYAVAHDLLVALPRWYNYFGHPETFSKGMVPTPMNGQKYQVFAYHNRFNYENIKDLMAPGAVFFTIMRDPASLFESAYVYYFMQDIYGMTLEKFVSTNKTDMGKRNLRLPGNGRIGRNQMTFDLGGKVEQFENETEILKMADTLDQQFQLVMILERMNESLVLLQHLLCWTTDDVVSMHLNARADNAKIKLSPELRAKILYWNSADKILYDYFLIKFHEKVEAFGVDRMKKEVQKLRTRIEQWHSYCVAGRNGHGSQVANNIEGFNVADVHNETCEYLVKDELVFTEELVKKQKERVYW